LDGGLLGLQAFCNVNCEGSATVKQQGTHGFLPNDGYLVLIRSVGIEWMRTWIFLQLRNWWLVRYFGVVGVEGVLGKVLIVF
jgi:hypothetical protein